MSSFFTSAYTPAGHVAGEAIFGQKIKWIVMPS